jgi:LPS-assembly protein
VMRAARTPRAFEGAKIATGSRNASGGHRRFIACIALFVFALAPISGAAAQSTPATPSAFQKPKGGIFGETPKVDQRLPLHLQGDELIYDTKGNKVIARGNVEIEYDRNNLTADEVIYDQSANTLSASGNVVLRQATGNVIRAERYTLTDDFRDGFIQSLSVVAKDDSRISAEQGTRRDGNVTEFSKAKFTPCKSDGSTSPIWCIAAAKVIHDQNAATISYEDAQFEMFGQPIFYLPYFQHPDPSVKRKSGFLAPGFGSSEDLGFFTEIPYYFALAPNYDFTFTPMYLSKQGVMFQGLWRHRLEDGQYTIKLAGIDQDGNDLPDNRLFTEQRRAELDGFRGTLETRGDFSLASWWRYGWDITLESDDTFRRFYKFDNILLTDRVNNVYFKGQSELNYFAANFYHFGGLLLDDSNTSESRVHPIVDYNYIVEDPVLGGELKFDANALSFSRSDGAIDRADQDMTRLVARAKWRRRLIDSLGITYTPFAELRGDLYQFNNYRDPESAEFVDEEQLARGLATGGATVSYPWIASGANASHTIEPIGQIVARQGNVNQNRFPDEDAKSLILDDTNLFETSKFSGWDRLETGTRANVGLQYTFQAWSGGYARVLAGQSYHLGGVNPYSNRWSTATGNCRRRWRGRRLQPDL